MSDLRFFLLRKRKNKKIRKILLGRETTILVLCAVLAIPILSHGGSRQLSFLPRFGSSAATAAVSAGEGLVTSLWSLQGNSGVLRPSFRIKLSQIRADKSLLVADWLPMNRL